MIIIKQKNKSEVTNKNKHLNKLKYLSNKLNC